MLLGKLESEQHELQNQKQELPVAAMFGNGS